MFGLWYERERWNSSPWHSVSLTLQRPAPRRAQMDCLKLLLDDAADDDNDDDDDNDHW